MTREQRSLRQRLWTAVCVDEHGFGRTFFGQRDLELHVERIAATIEECRERHLRRLSRGR